MQGRKFFDGDKVEWWDSNGKRKGTIIDGYFDTSALTWIYFVKNEVGAFVRLSESDITRRCN